MERTWRKEKIVPKEKGENGFLKLRTDISEKIKSGEKNQRVNR